MINSIILYSGKPQKTIEKYVTLICPGGPRKKVQKKVNQRIHFMNKVSKFHIDIKILSLFFESCIMSVMTLYHSMGREHKGETEAANG